MRNLPHGLDIYLVNVQTMGKTAKKIVAHSEKLNFTKKTKPLYPLGFELRSQRIRDLAFVCP